MSATIMFLEDNEELRAILAEVMLSELGETPITFGHMSDMVAAAAVVLRTKMAVIDINLGTDELTGIDAYNWLKKMSYAGKICFLTGHAKNHPTVQTAAKSGVEIWVKPMNANVLCESIRKTLKK
jgi:FixJ family two-component response regulator